MRVFVPIVSLPNTFFDPSIGIFTLNANMAKHLFYSNIIGGLLVVPQSRPVGIQHPAEEDNSTLEQLEQPDTINTNPIQPSPSKLWKTIFSKEKKACL